MGLCASLLFRPRSIVSGFRSQLTGRSLWPRAQFFRITVGVYDSQMVVQLTFCELGTKYEVADDRGMDQLLVNCLRNGFSLRKTELASGFQSCVFARKQSLSSLE